MSAIQTAVPTCQWMDPKIASATNDSIRLVMLSVSEGEGRREKGKP